MYSFEPIIFNFTHDTMRSLTALEYLEIDGCYMVEFLELLKYVGPNIKRMKIFINYKRSEDPDSIDEKIIDNLLCGDDGRPQIPGKSIKNTLTFIFVFVLVSLNRHQISFNYLSLSDFQLVLKLFPNLKHLTLSTLNSDFDFISATTWQQFISTNLLKLEKFQFYIRIDVDLSTIHNNSMKKEIYETCFRFKSCSKSAIGIYRFI